MTHTGDFNGGGKSDLVFRHTDGRIAIWLMSGTTVAGGGGINANAQLSAAIAAAPDFTMPATLATSSGAGHRERGIGVKRGIGVRSFIIIFLKNIKANINIKCDNKKPDSYL